ncbi:MAG: AbrB/MazE/SpoVT family DNA-binding domain-containing protein [Chloroflexota bacterium]
MPAFVVPDLSAGDATQVMYTQCIYIGVAEMRTRVQRWGNSLALRIPQAFGRELNLRPESSVDMKIDAGRLILVPIQDAPVPTLTQLLDQVTDQNRHAEVMTGPPMGDEIW